MTIEEAQAKYPILEHFGYKHLPVHLQLISKPLCDIATKMAQELPYDQETSAGLRKLLEAKDCLVRAELSRKKK